MREPSYIILNTRQARIDFDTVMAPVHHHDYDMNMVASYIIEALQVRRYCVENIETMVEYFASQFQGEDTAIATKAMRPLIDTVYSQLTPLELWDNSGELHYQFHRWLGYDIVVAHQPLALPPAAQA